MVWKNFKKNKKKNNWKIKSVEVSKTFKELGQISPITPKLIKRIKNPKKLKKIIVKIGGRKKDTKIQQNLFKITDPMLLKVGIRNSIDRLTGKKIKNSFAEKQEILLKRGLMRFNQKKSYKFKKKKDLELAPNFKKTMQAHKGKKFFRKLKKSIIFKKMKWNRFSLFYFKSKGLFTEDKKSWKNIKANKKITKIKLPTKYNLIKKIRAEKKSNIEKILNKLKTNKYKAIKVIEAKLSKFREKLIYRLHDNARLVATPIRQKSFKFLQSSLTKNIINFNNQYNNTHSGSLIKNSQEIYLQSKLKNLANKNQWGYNILTTDLKDSAQFAKQETEYFSNFLKQCFYKNLLFRSFWFNKFIGTLVRCGKKQMVWRGILRALGSLKTEFGKNPILILFEILEMYRMPLKALPPKDKTRKVIVRTHMVSWWKQYTQILRWLRHSFVGSVKNHTSWNYRIVTEMGNLLNLNHNTLIKKKCDINIELVAFGKVNLHFRWYRRFSKRAANAIKIIDGPLYDKDN